MKRWMFLIALAALLNPIAPASAAAPADDKPVVEKNVVFIGHPGPGHPGMHRMVFKGDGPPPLVDMLKTQLDLTADQESAARDLEAQLRETMKPLHEQLMGLQATLDKALDSGADAATVGNAAIAVHKLTKQMEAAHQEFHQSFSDLLTSEQKAKFESFHQRFQFRVGGPGLPIPPPGAEN
ncbi:MAG TPA: Spy/CpxP family protein refolding chaperone [Thermoanaerobaculia bacterium]|nr:Spy/CpxP family protein refolding chaperone [Thermoanaerobaculia bacterium]